MEPTGQSPKSTPLPGQRSADLQCAADGGTDNKKQTLGGLRKSVHDLRNHLNIIRNATYLLRRKLKAAGGENTDLVDIIDDAVTAAESVSSELMDRAIQAGEPPSLGRL